MKQHDDHRDQALPSPTPSGLPTLRVNTRPAGDPPDAADAPYSVERLAALSHELSGLLDGSLRWLCIAQRSLSTAKIDSEELSAVSRHLDTIQGAMERMVDLIGAAMKGSSSVIGSHTLSAESGITLKEAIEHAAQVVVPQADDRGIAIDTAVAPDLAAMPAGPVYSVILNGLRNAVESIIGAQDVQRIRSGGLIEVHAGLSHPQDARGKTHTLVYIEIRDDGAGITNGEAQGKAFEFGYTTKPGGVGLGLAVSREIVRELGGVIELSRRDDRPASGRNGAVLRISYPPINHGKRQA